MNLLQSGDVDRSTLELSANEKHYTIGGLQCNLRNDGRSRLDWRPIRVEPNPVPQVSGSTRLSLGQTEVLVSIKADIGAPLPDFPNFGQVVCSVDTSTMISTGKLTGKFLKTSGVVDDRAISEYNSELNSILYDAFVNSGAIDLKKYVLAPGEVCWILYIDALILDYDGNLVDCLVLATNQALLGMKLPCVGFEKSGEVAEIALLEQIDEERQLDENSLPVCVTLGIINTGECFVDPSVVEERCCTALIAFACRPDGAMVAMRKFGHGVFDPGRFSEYISTALTCSTRLQECLKADSNKV